MEQPGGELQPTALNRDSKFAPPREDFLLYLSRHARLLSSAMPGRMRIWISWKCAINVGRLAKAQTLSHVVVRVGQRRRHCGFASFFPDCFAIAFLHGEQKLRDHVPINAPKTLEGKERAAAPGEFTVPERRLPQIKHCFARFLVRAKLVEPLRDIAGGV